jgi:hypothetical protein
MLLVLAASAALLAQQWQAGAASVDITPTGPIWMAGYAARNKPSEGVLAPLHAKALAIDDGKRGRVVFVTTDIIGYPRVVAEQIAIAALKQHKLERSQLVLNASHTHSGPIVWPNLASMYFLPDAERAKVEAFTRTFITQVNTVIGAALANLKPATVEYSAGAATFAIHRRKPSPTGIKLAPNPDGPTDPLVPTLRVLDGKQQLTAVLFGYSCHNTTMTGEHYQLNGDYAGFAQAALEQRHPGTVALFATACAGDQNPEPRSSLELAQAHGAALADAVDKALATKGTPVNGRIRSRFQLIELPFEPFGRNDFEAALKSTNKYEVSRAQLVLKAMDARTISHTLSYPLQAIRLGSLDMITLGGEVVVDYCLRLRRETANPNLWVMAYSNDVMSYIPTRKQVEEGGYESKDSFLYYGQPAPLKGESEDIIIDKAKALLKGVR